MKREREGGAWLSPLARGRRPHPHAALGLQTPNDGRLGVRPRPRHCQVPGRGAACDPCPLCGRAHGLRRFDRGPSEGRAALVWRGLSPRALTHTQRTRPSSPPPRRQGRPKDGGDDAQVFGAVRQAVSESRRGRGGLCAARAQTKQKRLPAPSPHHPIPPRGLSPTTTPAPTPFSAWTSPSPPSSSRAWPSTRRSWARRCARAGEEHKKRERG